MTVRRRIEWIRTQHGAGVALATGSVAYGGMGLDDLVHNLWDVDADPDARLDRWLQMDFVGNRFADERYLPWLARQIAALTEPSSDNIERLEEMRNWWPEVSDWMIQTRPNDVDRVDWRTASRRAHAWHVDLAVHEKVKLGPDDQGPIEKSWSDGWTLQCLRTREHLRREGDAMGHCVGGYGDQVEAGRAWIYSLRDPQGQPHVTFETDGRGIIEQAKGHNNNPPGKKLHPRTLRAAMHLTHPMIDLPKDPMMWTDEHLVVLGEAAVALPPKFLRTIALRNRAMLEITAGALPNDHPIRALWRDISTLGRPYTRLDLPESSPGHLFLVRYDPPRLLDGILTVRARWDVFRAMQQVGQALGVHAKLLNPGSRFPQYELRGTAEDLLEHAPALQDMTEATGLDLVVVTPQIPSGVDPLVLWPKGITALESVHRFDLSDPKATLDGLSEQVDQTGRRLEDAWNARRNRRLDQLLRDR